MGYNALKKENSTKLKQITQQTKQLIAKDPSLGTRLNSDSNFAKTFVLKRLQHLISNN
uniref:Uncharacterized protein n=1 Tax=viral metagenome TaxID=1070528 RepID=A0A6C0H6X0_9ZZZZ